MGRTLYEKVFDRHTVRRLPSGQYQLFMGLHLVHEVTSPQAFAALRERGLPVAFPERTFATVDHIIPTTRQLRPYADPLAEEMRAALDRNVAESRVRFFAPERREHGIVHVLAPELGLTQPGMTVCCGDSHTSTHGAFGALAFGIGTSEVRDVLATQTLAVDPLRVKRLEVKGRLSEGVSAKDVILALIGELGVQGGVGAAYEFGGAVLDAFSMEERMTVCNMAIEGGARVGYVNPDATTYAYLRGRSFAPPEGAWERAVRDWDSLRSDPSASYETTHHLDGSAVEPMVTWGITPGQSVAVGAPLPASAAFSERERPLVEEAYRYMGLEPGVPLEGTAIDVAFIGSCTNGRLSDFEAAAAVLRAAGGRVAKNVRALVVPGSARVARELEERGLVELFRSRGFDVREPGCSMCLAMNDDKLVGRELCASSSNRNFKGRQGSPTGRTLLMSPAMVAAAALTGAVTDVRRLLRVSGRQSV